MNLVVLEKLSILVARLGKLDAFARIAQCCSGVRPEERLSFMVIYMQLFSGVENREAADLALVSLDRWIE